MAAGNRLDDAGSRLLAHINELEERLGTSDTGIAGYLKKVKKDVDAAIALRQSLESELARVEGHGAGPATDDGRGADTDKLTQRLSAVEQERDRLAVTLVEMKSQVKELSEEVNFYVQKEAGVK